MFQVFKNLRLSLLTFCLLALSLSSCGGSSTESPTRTLTGYFEEISDGLPDFRKYYEELGGFAFSLVSADIDINGDGLKDLVFHFWKRNISNEQGITKNKLAIFIQQPGLKFIDKTDYYLSGSNDLGGASSNVYTIADVNNDGKDEIIALPASKFIVYEYDNNRKIFQKKFNNINEFIAKQYPLQTIKFFNFEKKLDNSLLLTISYNYTGLQENSMIDILKLNLLDSSIKIINTFKHPSYVLNDGKLITSWIADHKGVFKYEDLNNDTKDELIFLGNFSFNNSLPSVFQSQ